MNLPSLTAENIGAALGIGGATLWIAIRTYLSRLKAEPAPKASDVILSGGAIADMGPFRAIERNTERMAAALEREAVAVEMQATCLGAIREMLVDRQKDADRDEEIMRRAEMMAQRMFQDLRPAPASRRRKAAR